MAIIRAQYRNGVFHPKDPVTLADGTNVVFEPRPEVTELTPKQETALTEIYRLMSMRFDGGTTDAAERHNEHQP